MVLPGGSFFNSFLGYGISTLLMLFLRRKSNTNNDTTNQQPSKFTEDTGSQVGNCVPVVMGRGLIKNPIVSYYGGFSYEPYLETYGMWTDLDWTPMIIATLISGLIMAFMPKEHPVVSAIPGVAVDSQNGIANNLMMVAVQVILMWLLSKLFSDHEGKVTIQKGFFYYLGWQHIICWTGEDIGIKRVWMNVYDPDVEASTQKGVWDNNNAVAWESQNINGIEAFIDDDKMFGGNDEGGGFIGRLSFYFGNTSQPKDPWMIQEMTNSQNIPQNLKGLTPQYPMYLTCVVTNDARDGGAYIGKQATVPEMWFEVVNYPQGLSIIAQTDLLPLAMSMVQDELDKVENWYSIQDPNIQATLATPLATLKQEIADWKANPPQAQSQQQDYPKNLLTPLDNFKNAIPTPTLQAEFEKLMKHSYNLANGGLWSVSQIDADANPASVIYEILTNKDWGCHYDGDRIDTNSLLKVGAVLTEEGLGISCVINNIAESGEYINKILKHINGVMFDDPLTGKLTFKLIRADYDDNDLPVFNVSNTKSCEFSRLDWSETASSVAVNFTNASDKYETHNILYTDNANRIITKSYQEKSIDGTYYTTPTNAVWLARTALLPLAYPLSAVNLVVNRDAFKLTVGDVFLLNWEPYGIERMVFRVNDIDYSGLKDGEIKLSAIEDVFGFEKLDLFYADAPSWVDDDKLPFDFGRWLFMEDPYELTADLNTYIYAYAAKPSTYTIKWVVYRYLNGGFDITADSTVFSTVGRVHQSVPWSFETDATGFEFVHVGTNGRELIEDKARLIASNPYRYNNKSGLNLVWCDEELMSYDSIEILANGHYQLKGVMRGIYDTLPRAHTRESVLFFIEHRLNINVNNSQKFVAYQGNISQELLELKTGSVNAQLKFDPSEVEPYITRRRTECPSVMANLKMGSDKGDFTEYKYEIPESDQSYSFDILFTFNPRNKFTMPAIIEQTDDTTQITMNNLVKYVVEMYTNQETFEIQYDVVKTTTNQQTQVPTTTNVTDIRFKWADVCKNMGTKVSEDMVTRLRIMSYDTVEDLYSYDNHEKHIVYTIPRLCGIVTSTADVQPYADSLINVGLNQIVIPASPVSTQRTLTFDECGLIFVGTPSTASDAFYGQDGNKYELTTEVYRIDSYDPSGAAIIHKIELDDYFIFSTDFVGLPSTEPTKYYQYIYPDFDKYDIYVVP